MSEPRLPPHAIAIVGMAGRFPGARSPEELWQLVRNGREAIRHLSDAELRAAGVPPALIAQPNYVKAAAVLDDMDMFDAGFFGFSPRDAAIMDPQHRHFLECAWEALESAGHVPESFRGSIGVFGGCGMQAYFARNLLNNPSLMASAGYFLVRHTGNDKDFLATRVSYQLNLRGPSVSVQTACSTSLVAVHLACQSLLAGECDLALAGGVTIELPHGHGYLYEDGEILSPDGHCRAFDARSKGTVFGSGVGLVALRRLDDALADGDHVHAVIIGSAVNNDGAGKVGYLAPSVDGQAAVVAEAIALAGVAPESIGYVETHGTGTPVGDPIEVAALAEAFGRQAVTRQFCGIGSIKTNIGHLDTAAGVASLIKAVSAVEAGELPPSLHFETPNPVIPFAETPFYVNATLRPWTSPGPRRAGVTSLGVGGTNAHVLLEQAPVIPARPASRSRPSLLLLSARTASARDRAGARLAAHLHRHPELSLDDVSFTLQDGRRAFPQRLAVVARDAAEAIEQLEHPAAPFRRLGAVQDVAPTMAFMFPGGGAQRPGMAADIYAAEPVFREALDRCLSAARRHVPVDLTPLVVGTAGAPTDEETAALERPSLALPALFATEYALAQLLQSWGLTPAAFIGHSLGEYVAACLSGVMSVDDGVRVVSARGRLFETLPAGRMVSVPVSPADLSGTLGPDLSIAAVNGPSLSVVSGPVPAIERFSALLAERGIECQRLRIAVAAHSSMLEPILAEFLDVMRAVRLSRPQVPFISNVTGTWITDTDAASPEYWVRHLRSTVQFSAGIATLAADPNRRLVEVGPGTALTSIARLHAPSDRAMPTLGRAADAASAYVTVMAAAGELWVQGVALDAGALRGDRQVRRVPLPTYPFEHARYWIDPETTPASARRETAPAAGRDVTRWLQVPVWTPAASLDRLLPGAGTRWLIFGSAGTAAALAAAIAPRGGEVIVVQPADGFVAGQGEYGVNPTSESDFDRLFADLDRAQRTPTHVVYAWVHPETSPRVDAFTGFLNLAKALVGSGTSAPLRLAVVTDRLTRVADSERVEHPDQALVVAASRVVATERPATTAIAIDIDDQSSLPLVVDEMLAVSPVETVALRAGRRWRCEHRPLPPPDPSSTAPVRRDGVYLMTGGLGGIALTIADALARTERVHLVLVSRHGLPPQSEWADWLAGHPADDLTSDRIRQVQALEARGSRVDLETVDIADHAAVVALVTRIRTRAGAIHGVVHAAGVLDDDLVPLKTAARSAAVLAPKVAGTRALAEAIGTAPLDFWVNCSSVSALVGIPGQFDYAAANAFLDAFAEHRAADPADRTVSINWQAWRDVGMLRPAAPAPPEAVDDADGVPIDRPLVHRHRQAGTSHVFSSVLSTSDWILDEHRLQAGGALLPGTAFLELAGEAARTAMPDASVIVIEDLVLQAPFHGGERARVLRTSLDTATGELTMSSGHAADAVEHARGLVRTDAGSEAPRLDLVALEARCVRQLPDPTPNLRHLRLGPRWRSEAIVRAGHDELIATVRFPLDLVAELPRFQMHPALVDVATACGLWLAGDYQPEHDFCVPLSYGRVVIHDVLPDEIFVHARNRADASTAANLVVFDLTIADAEGRPRVTIEQFAARRLRPESLLQAPAPGHVHAADHAPDLTDAIRPGEGAMAFLSVLRSLPLPRVIVGPADLESLRSRAARLGAGGDPLAPGGRGRVSTAPVIEPRDDLERSIAAIWSDLLGVETIGIDDNFFELGGHSLLLTQVGSRVRRILKAAMPMTALFEHPTIRAMADLLRSHQPAEDEPALVAVPRAQLKRSRASVGADPAGPAGT